MQKNRSVMYAIALLQGMVFYSPIATLYRQAQGVTVFQITVIESVSLALGILLEIPWGVVADRIGYRNTMIFCSGLYFVSKLVFWRATGFGGFLSERIMLSVVLAGVSGVDSSILYLSCQEKDTQKVFGIYNSLGMVGLLMSAAVFSLFVKDDYALAGLLTVISYGLAALLSLGITEVKQLQLEKAPPEPFKTTVQKTFRNRPLLLFLIAVALMSETHQTVTVFLNQLQYERCGLPSSAIGFVYLIATLLGLLGVYSSAVTRRVGLSHSLTLFCGLAIASCLVLGLTRHALPSVMGIFTLRICDTLFQPFQAEIQNRQVKSANRATALSVYAMFTDGIGIGTNLIFGALSDWSLPSAFFFGGGICTLSLMLFSFWRKQTPDFQASPPVLEPTKENHSCAKRSDQTASD